MVPNSGLYQPSFRRITGQEARERHDKGLCYYCDEKFVTRHRYTRPQLFMIVDCCPIEDMDISEDSPPSNPIENMPEISFHAMAGATHPRTLRLQGVLKNWEVTVLIDSGSTHNFIDQSIVYSLGLPVVRDRTFQVMVGNRETISCSGRCLSLTLGIQNQHVQPDFYVLPVAACPIVLGVQWLETLRPVEMDYKNLTMRFIHQGRPC
ncbi:hypothetical protein MRB53_030751 [Persea americana]|uniref:Uncharacterized protein n=1 Tax=Persea americana TaxID=3435 RepID=A0ACC2KMH2_PERAE|nr:hypothetical protein MRB53_030751 [Persea americana]